MNKDRVAGAAKQMKGGVKAAAGKMSGNTKLETEGKGGKLAGKAQSAVGRVKDAGRHAGK